MTANLAGFRARFPEFSSSVDASVNFALAEAREIHNRSTLATLFLTAHLLSIDSSAKGVGAGSGEGTMKKAGPLSATYITQAERGREAAFTTSSYGKRFLVLEQRSPRSAIGAMVV